MKKVLIGIVAGLTVLMVGGVFLGAAAVADGGRNSGGWGDRPLGRLIRGEIGRWMTLGAELDLTAEQKEEIGGILREHRAEITRVMKPVVEKRRELREAVAAEPADEGKIRAAAEDLGKAIGDAAVVGAKIKGEVAGVLTAEQKGKIAAFRAASDRAVDALFEDAEEGGK